MKQLIQFLCAVILVSSILVQSGCATNPSADQYSSQYATRVFTGSCIFGKGPGEAASVLAAILPSLISTSFNLFSQTLEASGKEQAWTGTGSANFELDENGKPPKCIQIIRGYFTNDGNKADYSKWVPYNEHSNNLMNANIYLSAPPDFFFEGAIRRSFVNNVYSIVPVVADYRAPIGERWLRFDSARYVNIGFTFLEPGKSLTDNANSQTNLNLGKFEPNSIVKFDQSCLESIPSNISNNPIPTNPNTNPDVSTTNSIREKAQSEKTKSSNVNLNNNAKTCSIESLWFFLPKTEEYFPMSVNITVSEVQGESEFYKFISDVFKGSKNDLEKIAKESLISSEREKARLISIQTNNELLDSFTTAVTDALSSLENCSKEGSITDISNVIIKQRAANLAAEKAGNKKPFKPILDFKIKSGEAKKACQDYIQNLKL